jgi:Cu/Ag efflux pump CusA
MLNKIIQWSLHNRLLVIVAASVLLIYGGIVAFRAQIAIKLFGPDLATLRTKAGEIRDAMETVPGVVDLLVEPQVGVPQVQVNMNRQAAAAVGLRAEDLAETVDMAFNGHVASQLFSASPHATASCSLATTRT